MPSPTNPYQELLDEQGVFRQLFESSNDAIMLLDEKGFFDCNKATLKIFGYEKKEDFCNKHPSEHSPPKQPDGSDSKESANANIEHAKKIGKNFFEWIHRRANGNDFPAEVLLTPLTINGKSILQATVRDITEKKRKEKELLEMNKYMVGREIEMTKLKEKVKELEEELRKHLAKN